jgi:RNA polymerase sigma factor (sigma-70 family)
MGGVNRGIVFRQIDHLFREGSLVGLADGQLLDRYLTRRDEAAFEALINIHGPMVLGLCRRILRDPSDVEDAFQATFLVLVRKASAIRDRTLLSNWLYGVAFRVATRARTNSLRRRGRETPVASPECAVEPDGPDAWEVGPALDQELSRLPGKFRAPLVLCYLRGQTHDQAAEELRCPVGTVRSRLARGRDLLKKRLTRRGFAPTSAVLGTKSILPAQLITEAVPQPLVTSTVAAAFASSTFTTIQAGAVSAPVLALTQGVLSSMKFAYVKWIGLAILTTGLSVGGAAALSHARTQSAPSGADRDPSLATDFEPQEASSPQSTSTVSTTIQSAAADDPEKEIERKIDQLLKDIGFFGTDASDGRPASVAARVLRRKLGELLGPTTATSSSTIGTSGSSASTSQISASTRSSNGSTSVSRSPTSSSSATRSTRSASVAPPQADPNIDSNDPFRLSDRLTTAGLDAQMRIDRTRQSIPALGVDLKLALETFDRVEVLYQKSAISAQERAEARGRVLRIAASLEGLYDELIEENDRLALEFKKKRAELGQAQAQREVAASVVARNGRLNERKAGVVVQEDVVKAESELKGADASVQVKEIELEELELRREQLRKRAAQIKQVLALAERANAAGHRTPAPPPGGAPSTP